MSPPVKLQTDAQKLEAWNKARAKQYERSKKYYEKVKNTPEWKEKKHAYYLKRKQLKLQEQDQQKEKADLQKQQE